MAGRGVGGTVLVLLAALAGLAGAGGGAKAAEPVTVFAAASLKNGLDAVDALYQRRSGVAVRASYAASSVLARQIEAGAPAQVFLSADTDWMDELQARGRLVAGSRHDLLTNHLALIAPVGAVPRLAVGPRMPLAAALGPGGRLALAGADVPAGRYARASLQALGAWEGVRDRVVYGDSVRAALSFVDRGEAALGVVYDTDARIDPGVKVVGLFPDASHPPIVYPAALVAGASAQATDYLRFVEGREAAAVFRRFGFEPAPLR